MLKKSVRIIAHALFWSVHLLFVAIIAFAALQGKSIPPEDYSYYLAFIFGVAMIPPAFSFYMHYRLLFTTSLQRGRLLESVVLSLVLSICSALIGFLAMRLISVEAQGCVIQGMPFSAIVTTGIAFVYGVFAVVLRGFFTWYYELKLKEELLQKNFDMELALVKAQLDPHFLFNTINNIDMLIEKDAARASDYLNKLSEIMRFMLYESKTDLIPLAQELAYIEKFIALQRIRSSNPNYVHYTVQGDSGGRQIAPMVLIPFVENAFKHTNKKNQDAIDINIEINETGVVFRCRNMIGNKNTEKDHFNGLGQFTYPAKT